VQLFSVVIIYKLFVLLVSPLNLFIVLYVFSVILIMFDKAVIITCTYG